MNNLGLPLIFSVDEYLTFSKELDRRFFLRGNHYQTGSGAVISLISTLYSMFKPFIKSAAKSGLKYT